MSRFDHLEFDEAELPEEVPQRLPLKGRGTPIRDAQWYLQQAEAAFHINQPEPALRAYSQMLEEDPVRLEGWFGQVRMLLELGEYPKADLWAGKALERFPEHPSLLAAKAVASLRMGKVALALGQSDNAMSRKGATPYVWLARADILLATGKKMAMQCLEKGLQQETEPHAKGWMEWEVARLLRHYKRAAQAHQHATVATELLPRESGTWLERGLCEQALGLNCGRQSLEHALELDEACLAARKALKNWHAPGLAARLRGLFA